MVSDYTCRCGAKEGELHILGCDAESCPFCEVAGITNCGCGWKFFGYDYEWGTHQAGLPDYEYKNGFTDEQYKIYDKVLMSADRWPFLRWSFDRLCGRCGRRNPKGFLVSDKEWATYIEPCRREKIFCKECYKFIKEKIEKLIGGARGL